MSQKELAAKWKVNRCTINRWQKLGAPLNDDALMGAWIEQHRSRIGVGKYTPKRTESAVQEIVAEVVGAKPLALTENVSSAASDAPVDIPGDPRSTLARLEEAERVAYQRYIDSGGSERAGQMWVLIADQKRKLMADQAKQASDISEAETKFMSQCWEVIWELFENFKASPALLGMLCEGLDRHAIQLKVEGHIRRTINGAAQTLAVIMGGSSLRRIGNALILGLAQTGVVTHDSRGYQLN